MKDISKGEEAAGEGWPGLTRLPRQRREGMSATRCLSDGQLSQAETWVRRKVVAGEGTVLSKAVILHVSVCPCRKPELYSEVCHGREFREATPGGTGKAEGEQVWQVVRWA